MTYYFIDDFDNICRQKDGMDKDFAEVIDLVDLIDDINKLAEENKELKDKNSRLQETLAFRSNQLALMEQLIDDLGSEEMLRQMELILNDCEAI